MKKYLEKNVYEALQDRLKFIFDNFDNIYVSFSGGKDSGLLLNMVLSYKRRNKIAKKSGFFIRILKRSIRRPRILFPECLKTICATLSHTGSACRWGRAVRSAIIRCIGIRGTRTRKSFGCGRCLKCPILSIWTTIRLTFTVTKWCRKICMPNSANGIPVRKGQNHLPFGYQSRRIAESLPGLCQ